MAVVAGNMDLEQNKALNATLNEITEYIHQGGSEEDTIAELREWAQENLEDD